MFIRRCRRNITYLFIVSILVNVGMWFERFVIIVTSLARDFNPYAWGTYKPTFVEIGITVGSFGLFFTLFLIFVKLLPVLSITELKEVTKR
jgi:molybdopterin-containing oxidoreductase family membrane subunit